MCHRIPLVSCIAILIPIIGAEFLVSRFVWAGQLLWDFEDPKQLDEWELINGTWVIRDGILREISGDERAMHAFVGDEEWEDYTLEAKVRVDEGNYAGLVFRALNELEYYVFYVELMSSPRDLCFFKYVGGVLGRPIRHRPKPNKTDISGEDLRRGKWLTMKILVRKNEFTCFINNKKICVGTDDLGDHNRYREGKIGVWAWQTKASFDDLKIRSADIEGIAVGFRDKLAIAWGEIKVSH